MAQLTSEAEFERLYQEFVRRNGGIPTLAGDQYNTPAEYYSATTENTLSPSELAELQARQAQYNRQSALNTINSEITNNNFTNPYNARSQSSISNLNSINSIPITINDYHTGQPTQTTIYNQLGSLNNTLSPLLDENLGGGAVVAALVYAGIAEATGVDIEKLLLGAGLITAGIAMFTDLQNHTNNQAVDIPGKINEIDQMSGLNKSFGEMPTDSCSLFNDLMGIMSGSFDGVLDFIDGGIDQFKDFMNSTALGQGLNQLSGILDGIMSDILSTAAGIIGGISGMISGVISNIKSAVTSFLDSSGLTDVFNKLGNLASGIIGGITDMASQILGEIEGLISMAADIANKLAALSLAGAMMDPCKMKVLLNTGTPELAGAAAQLTAPIESAIPSINIPTEIDPRANPTVVSDTINSAVANAATLPGVPQSPFNALATLYSPFSAYLHDLLGPISGIFSEQYELSGSVLNSISDTSPNNPLISGLSQITGNLQGTIGDISSNVLPLSMGSPVNTEVSSANSTWEDPDSEDFTTGGADSNEPAVVDASQRTTEPSRVEPARSRPEDKAQSRIVTEQTAEGTVQRVEGPSNQIASVRSQWNRDFKSKYGRVIRDANKISSEISRYLESATFRSPDLARESELLLDDSIKVKQKTTDYMKSQSGKFSYRSRTQDRDPAQEKRITDNYNNIMKSQNSIMLSRFEQEIYEITQTWNSVKRQAIL
jgi:hypothetical protein